MSLGEATAITTTNTQNGGFEQPIGNNCDAVANIFGAAGALASYALLPQKEHEPIFDTRAAIEQSPYFTAAVKMFRADQGKLVICSIIFCDKFRLCFELQAPSNC